MSIKLFDGTGINRTKAPADSAFVVIYAKKKGDLDKTYLLYAPIAGIQISQSTDYNVSKALSGDYLITTFLDKAVNINITGIYSFTQLCQDSTSNTKQSIMTFYDKYKVSNDPTSRLHIQLKDSNTIYKCVLLSASYQGRNKQPGMMAYSMRLLGVAQTGDKS